LTAGQVEVGLSRCLAEVMGNVVGGQAVGQRNLEVS
jgi:hypothetical protein